MPAFQILSTNKCFPQLLIEFRGNRSGATGENPNFLERSIRYGEPSNKRGNFDRVERWPSTALVAKRQRDEGIIELGVPRKVMT